MAWNRPSDDKVKVKVRGEQRNVHLKGVVAGAIVIVGAAVAAWWLWPNEESAGETPPPHATQRIKEAKPAVAQKPKVEDEKAPVRKLTLVEQNRLRGVYTNEYGYVFNEPHTNGVVTNSVMTERLSLAARIFENSADRKIGTILSITPGTSLVGDLPKGYFGEAFVRSFLDSIKTPIIVAADDPEDVAALKRMVRQAKIELKAAYDRGEDIGAIMENERKELRTIGLYREDLKNEVRKAIARDDKMSEEDVQAFVDAANQLLAERGAEPLKMPQTAILQLDKDNEGESVR